MHYNWLSRQILYRGDGGTLDIQRMIFVFTKLFREKTINLSFTVLGIIW